jgi:hypothetical protein
VLIRNHHPGYVSWETYERNEVTLAENALSPPVAEGPKIAGITGTQGPTRRWRNGSSP